jgi:hypothetical protein
MHIVVAAAWLIVKFWEKFCPVTTIAPTRAAPVLADTL